MKERYIDQIIHKFFLRYDVDDSYALIIVNEKIKLIEKRLANRFIRTELYDANDILLYISFVFDIYDEVHDTIILIQLARVFTQLLFSQ